MPPPICFGVYIYQGKELKSCGQPAPYRLVVSVWPTLRGLQRRTDLPQNTCLQNKKKKFEDP